MTEEDLTGEGLGIELRLGSAGGTEPGRQREHSASDYGKVRPKGEAKRTGEGRSC